MDPVKCDDENSHLSLHDICKIVGDQLTCRDVRMLKLMFNGIFTQEFLAQIHDGATFLLALEKIDRLDESNFKNIENYLRMINRHDLFHLLTLRRRKTVRPDPVTEYLEECANANTVVAYGGKSTSPSACSDDTRPSCSKSPSSSNSSSHPSSTNQSTEPSSSSLKTTEHSCVKRPHDTDKSSASPKSKKAKTELSGHSRLSELPNTESNSSPSANSEQPSEGKSLPGKSRRRSGKWLSEATPRRRSERLKRRSEELDSGTIAISAAEQSQDYVESIVQSTKEEQLKKKVTCDIRLRVRAEYVNHQTALQGNIHSNKPELLERQFEKFMQANTILKSRDLGSIICDIKFSELTYLDAFWRDYINGSLLEALKGVFITESLKQAVGNEAIKLLVNVDEDDYEAGRLMLLKSLKDSEKSA